MPPTTPVCGPPTILSLPPRPNFTTGICLERQVIPSARMEAIMQHYVFTKQQDFQKKSLDSPQLLGDPLQIECTTTGGYWATGQGFDPLGPTAAQIAALLYELFDTHGLSLQTIKEYRSCLATVLNRTGRTAAVLAKTISDVIMSMESQRPICRLTPVLPQRDLGIVPEALIKPPYEPVRASSV